MPLPLISAPPLLWPCTHALNTRVCSTLVLNSILVKTYIHVFIRIAFKTLPCDVEGGSNVHFPDTGIVLNARAKRYVIGLGIRYRYTVLTGLYIYGVLPLAKRISNGYIDEHYIIIYYIDIVCIIIHIM